MAHAPHAHVPRWLIRRTGLMLGLALSLGLIAASLSPRAALAQPGQGNAKPKTANQSAFPPLSKLTEGMTKIGGLMTLYRHPDKPQNDHTVLLCRIPASLMGQDLLMATSISRGDLAGFMWRDELVRWERLGKHILLVAPEQRHVRSKDEPVNDAIERTHQPTILASAPIKTMAGSDPVIDLGPLLMSNLASPPSPMGFWWFNQNNARPNPRLSKYRKIKNFPKNILIDVDLAMSVGNGSFRPVGVSYGFRKLPALGGYTPRPADERIGFFNTVRRDWSLDHTARDTVVRYINRWNLQKRDPSLELSPPKEPIVFIVEKTVPIRWRHWVRQGVAEWNKAFEKIGFVDAIVVQQQTETNEYADYDPEDARYNFIRWIVTGRGFAMGPSRADPRTGQILDADIIIDDAFLRYYMREADLKAPEAWADMSDPMERAWMGRYHAAERGAQGQGGAHDPIDPHPGAYEADAVGFQRWNPHAPTHRCSMGCVHGPAEGDRDVQHPLHASRLDQGLAAGLSRQLLLGQLAVATPSGKKLPDRLIGEAIKWLVMHEVGHTLGLRHNFKASSWLSLEEVRRRRDQTDQPTAASVMDYNPLMFFAGDKVEELRHIATPTLGPWDEWVIEYGYRQPGPNDGGLKKMLKAIAARNTEEELAYGSDEDTFSLYSPDPQTQRFDVSSDPMAYAQSRLDLIDPLLRNLREWAIDEDDPAYRLRQVFGTLFYERVQPALDAAKFVGGQYVHRNRLSDPNAKPPLVIVEPAKQRQALTFLAQGMLSASFYDAFPPELLNYLRANRHWDWTSRMNPRVDYPIHAVILGAQERALFDLIAPVVVQRVYDAQVKTNHEDPFTAAELIQRTGSAVWSELDQPLEDGFTDAEPMIGSIRRNLQQRHLDFMLGYVQGFDPQRMSGGYYRWLIGAMSVEVSPDLKVMARQSLRDLGDRIEAKLTQAETKDGSKLDFASRAHLSASLDRIERALEAVYIER